MAGWIRVEQDAHERRLAFLRGIPIAIDPDTARDDLRLHQDRRLGPSAVPFPSVRDLADRWGWSKSAVDRLLAHGPASWSDPARLEEWVVVLAKSPGTEAGQKRDRSGTKRIARTPDIERTRDRSGTEAGQKRDSAISKAPENAEEIHPSPSPSPSPFSSDKRENARAPVEQPALLPPPPERPDPSELIARCRAAQEQGSQGRATWTRADENMIRGALPEYGEGGIDKIREYFLTSGEFQPIQLRNTPNFRWTTLLNAKRQTRYDHANEWFVRDKIDKVEAVATGPPVRNGHKPKRDYEAENRDVLALLRRTHGE